ncbi:MAG: hypothetical protein OEU68_03605 [Nitrospira sp.]|nr:hypothetical protein [Nitrospira sp.]MDH4244925.1 hypothetical protein [Nitrospira sp.]MDH4354819.1 hypothetical protein [Nitrospira sp.]MDH5317107.1 hypothetical protein [Nitrospira sp.]
MSPWRERDAGILGVEIVFPEIRQRAIYCPCCAHRETDVMKIVALAGV